MTYDPLDASGVEPARRPWSKALVGGSLACGLGAFALTVVLSQMLVPAADGTVEVSAALLALTVLFVVLFVACMVLGYLAARRR